ILEDDDLETYLELLSSAHPDLSWSREERLSYWINAYNAFTVKLILDNYPVESIKDISGPWTKEFIVIEGIPYSLGDIEHKVLRKLYNEPRIHYAISCASISCPDLPNEAIMADILEGQLDRMAERFINDPSKNLIEKDEVKLSKIYKWFKSDFTVSSSLKDHLKKYSTVEIDKATKIEYLEYNWKLNDIASKEH
ncbi:MAG: DUF547 domain-containing protein, partial [Flavobacteriales bacterium]|nr:DUF547 domain-containing protein [Flavobacteriales bacterium]